MSMCVMSSRFNSCFSCRLPGWAQDLSFSACFTLCVILLQALVRGEIFPFQKLSSWVLHRAITPPAFSSLWSQGGLGYFSSFLNWNCSSGLLFWAGGGGVEGLLPSSATGWNFTLPPLLDQDLCSWYMGWCSYHPAGPVGFQTPAFPPSRANEIDQQTILKKTLFSFQITKSLHTYNQSSCFRKPVGCLQGASKYSFPNAQLVRWILGGFFHHLWNMRYWPQMEMVTQMGCTSDLRWYRLVFSLGKFQFWWKVLAWWPWRMNILSVSTHQR